MDVLIRFLLLVISVPIAIKFTNLINLNRPWTGLLFLIFIFFINIIFLIFYNYIDYRIMDRKFELAEASLLLGEKIEKESKEIIIKKWGL